MELRQVSLDPLWSRREVASLLNVSLKTLRGLELSGALAPIRINSRVLRYRDSTINKFLASRSVTV